MRLLAFGVAAMLFCGCNINNPTKGKKIGHIVKIAHEGMIFSTCEIELIRGGFTDGSGTMGQTFHCTITDDRLKEKAVRAMNDGKEVTISYKAPFMCRLSSSECGVFVTEIEI